MTRRNRSNTVRIIGGQWRRRHLRFPDSPGLRPSPDRVRETLFNWLGQDLVGLRCLDLFAGSGALGFEALSRQAAHVTFVEASRHVIDQLRANAALLGVEHGGNASGAAPGRAEIRSGDALEFVRHYAGVPFDLVFLDPPFGAGWIERVLPLMAPLLGPDARVYIETERLPDAMPDWEIVRAGHAGAVNYALARRAAPADQESMRGMK